MDDIHTLSGERFFTWTERFFAYPGAVQARARVELAEKEEEPEEDVPITARAHLAGDGYRFPPVVEDRTKRGVSGGL